MTLSINCKDAGDPCMYPYDVWWNRRGSFEQCQRIGIKEHGYAEESWNEILSKVLEHFKKIIKQV